MIRPFLLSGVIGVAALLGTTAGSFAQPPPAQPKHLSASGTEAERETVREVTNDWLSTLDQGNTAQSFRALAASTSSAVNEAKWQSAVAKMRTDFGAPKGREFHKITLFQGAGGTEPDAYLVEYDSVSAEHGALHEIVRVVKDDDGTWRVAGYTVGPKHQGGDDNDED